MIANLFDSHYKPVQSLTLPEGKRPDVILLGDRVFQYYAYAAPVGYNPSEHPYREIDHVHIVPGVLIK